MLVISRKQNQSFEIGDSIVVTINKIKASQVSIAILAPKSMDIVRSEIKHMNHDRKANGIKKDASQGTALRLAVRAGRNLP